MILRMEKFDAAMATIQSALKKIDSETAKTKSKLAGLADGMAGVGKKMSMAFTLPFSVMSFAAIGTALGDSVKNASDLNETVSKASVIFGTSSKDMMKWSDGAAQNLGMSKRAALDSASSFALFAKQAGLSGKAVNEFSKQNVQMAADLASFFNSSPEEAITAMTAALRGESEPIRRYNVLLDDASLRQAAFKKGLISSTKEGLTPQQRVLAAQSLIMQQASAAVGDFARTSGQLANQQRIQAAEYENVSAKLGTSLLPVMLAFKSTVVDVLKWISDLSEGQKKAIVYIGAAAVAIGPVLVILGKLIACVGTATAIYGGLKAAITGATLATNASKTAQVAYTVATKAATIAQTALNVAMKANPIILIISLLIAAVSAVAAYAASCDSAADKEKKLKSIREQRLAADKGELEVTDEAIRRNKTLTDSYDRITDVRKREAKVLEHINELEMARRSSGLADEDREKRTNEDVSYWRNYLREVQTSVKTEADAKKAATEEWLRMRQAALADLKDMETQAANDSLIEEGARYEKDLAKYKEYLKRKGLDEKEANRYLEAINDIHNQKVEDKAKAAATASRDAWKSSLDTQSTDFAAKITQISDLDSNFVSSSQKAAMSVAAAFTSAFAVISSLFSSMIQAQEAEVEEKYSTLTAEEQAYVDYQDAEDSKAYKKMSAKEKKEHDLKAASDKAEKKREAEKQKALQKLQREQARLNLINAIAQIGVGTAMGVMNIWSNKMNDSPFEAYRVAMTAFVIGLGAAQIAAATAAAAPSLATGAKIKASPGGSYVNVAEAGYDEYVVPDTKAVMSGIASRITSALGISKAQGGEVQGYGQSSRAGVDTLSLVPVSVKVNESTVCDILFGWSRNGKLLTAESAVVAI